MNKLQLQNNLKHYNTLLLQRTLSELNAVSVSIYGSGSIAALRDFSIIRQHSIEASRLVSSIGRTLDCESGDLGLIPGGAGNFRCD
jgi:hypothetical protein